MKFDLLVDQPTLEVMEEVSNFDLCIAEDNFEEVLQEVEMSIRKEDQVAKLIELRDHLKGDEARAKAVLHIAKEHLDAIGVDTTSCESAVECIDKVIENYDPSGEAWINWALIAIIIIVDLILTYQLLSNAGVTIRKMVGNLGSKNIGDADEKKYNQKTKVVSSQNFSKVIAASIKALDALKTDSIAKRVGVKTLSVMEGAAKSAGIVMDANGDIAKSSWVALEPKEQSVKEAGWTKSNISSGLTDLIKLSKVLESFTDVEAQAQKQKSAIQQAKDAGGDKNQVKDNINEIKVAGKKIKRLSKDLLKLVKIYSKSYSKAFYVFVD